MSVGIGPLVDVRGDIVFRVPVPAEVGRVCGDGEDEVEPLTGDCSNDDNNWKSVLCSSYIKSQCCHNTCLHLTIIQ